MIYVVAAIRDIHDMDYGIEIAGIFDTEEKAFKAKTRVEKWMEIEGYENCDVFSYPMNVNRLEWYEVEEDI